METRNDRKGKSAMNSFFKEIGESDISSCELYKLAENTDNLDLNIEHLDKPITDEMPWLQETSISDGKDGLTKEEQEVVKKETGWSSTVIESIGSMEEYEIYKNANVEEVEINGKTVLTRTDIDLDKTDEDGISNRQRMERGLAPLASDGRSIELHHIGQKADSPLIELTPQEHMENGNNKILHDTRKESEIDRREFDKIRIQHWKNRSEL